MSGFPGTDQDFYSSGGFTGRSLPRNNSQNPYQAMFTDPASQILHGRSDLIGKRSLAEFQIQQQNHLYLKQRQEQHIQQQQIMGLCLRNIKQRPYQYASPISPLSPVDISSSTSPDVSSISSTSSVSSRYGIRISQQLRPVMFPNVNSTFPSTNHKLSGGKQEPGEESEKNMMNRLQELEKQLLDDDNDGQGDAISVVTRSEWSETIQNLISQTQKPISPSPTSSSSSCSSSTSPPTSCPKQSLVKAASAISDGKTEVATEILRQLKLVSNLRGTSEERLTAYMASALKSRVNPTEFPPPIIELCGKDHFVSTQMLYEISPCFELGFMAANLAIVAETSQQQNFKLHVLDFDIGHGGQYPHLIQALASRTTDNLASLKITTFADFTNGRNDKLKVVIDGLKSLAIKSGICFNFNVLNLKITDLSPEKLCVEKDEVLAVNFAFRLYKLPDESVTTENIRDEVLRRVKGLSPAVVTVVEQEMNANTAPFLGRVTEACEYYGALFDSLEATVGMESPDRVKIEEGLGRKAANSVACEGRDRVERCELFGKWRARMCMAGFQLKSLSPNIADSLRTRLTSGPCGNPGFTVNEETGGICCGWKGRTLSVASAWR